MVESSRVSSTDQRVSRRPQITELRPVMTERNLAEAGTTVFPSVDHSKLFTDPVDFHFDVINPLGERVVAYSVPSEEQLSLRVIPHDDLGVLQSAMSGDNFGMLKRNLTRFFEGSVFHQDELDFRLANLDD